MKQRVLRVHRISEEQLKGLLHLVQGIVYKDPNNFVIRERNDWYIVLYILFEVGVVEKGKRPPYAAFARWMNAHVMMYRVGVDADMLGVMSRRLADGLYPWKSKNAPKDSVRRWEVINYHISQIVNKLVLLND